MKIIIFCFLSFALFILSISLVKGQDIENSDSQTMYPQYKNRVSLNLLGLPSANLVMSYERAFKNKAIWLGFNYHLNGLLKEEDRNMFSVAAEYRYYFFANKSYKFSNGLFGGLYVKYRTGKETKIITLDNINYSHSYNNFFAGLNLGYRYNYKRLALSAFAGYGFLISSREKRDFIFFDSFGKEVKLSEGYKNDLRLGITLGFAF
ncbi:hypothetical protein ACE193_17380 [Bernardetia sp. OM2101]|uniref:hypothetical protein n=1 Tax=Bernardetia sp. OM2101 TaxID=3344876 RepID=UPI0035D020DD